LAATYWAFNAYVSSSFFHVGLAATYFLFDLVVGIGITHAYRQLAHTRSWIQLGPSQLFKVILPAILLTGTLYAVLIIVKNYCARLVFNLHFESTLIVSFQRNFLTVLATGIRLTAIWILAFHLYHYAMMQIRIAKENARLAGISARHLTMAAVDPFRPEQIHHITRLWVWRAGRGFRGSSRASTPMGFASVPRRAAATR